MCYVERCSEEVIWGDIWRFDMCGQVFRGNNVVRCMEVQAQQGYCVMSGEVFG